MKGVDIVAEFDDAYVYIEMANEEKINSESVDLNQNTTDCKQDKGSSAKQMFELGLWSSRLMVILAVLFGLLGAIILFAVASVDIFDTAKYVVTNYISHAHPEHFHAHVVGGIIGAVYLYLIGVVMLLFSFGLYELFISDIDVARDAKGCNNKILTIHSLDQLKDKISKVIVMVLVVGFFQKVGVIEYTNSLDMLYFAFSITAISVGLYFLGKVGK